MTDLQALRRQAHQLAETAHRLAAEAHRLAAKIAEYEATQPTPKPITANELAHPGGVLLCAKQLAKLLGLSRRTLDTWRCTGEGPPYSKFGGAVRYDWHDVEEWREGRKVKSTTDATVRGIR